MKPVNENATKEAKELLAYLYETAGKKIITGQHTQTNPMEEITYIHEKTGAYPKLQGFELLSYSPNINYADASEACLTEVKENQGTMDTLPSNGQRRQTVLFLSVFTGSHRWAEEIRAFTVSIRSLTRSRYLWRARRSRKLFIRIWM